jgi:hypothetical protein
MKWEDLGTCRLGIVCIVAMFLGLPLLATRLGGEETWLNYRIARSATDELGNIGSHSVKLSDQRPASWPSFAPGVGERAWFGEFLGHAAIVAQSRPNSQDWDVLWFDADGNKRFDSNERFVLESEWEGIWRGLVPIVFHESTGPRIQHSAATVYVEDPKRPPSLGLRSAGYYIGKVKFGEKSHWLALVDNNANGLFNDASSETGEGDWIFVDQNDQSRLGPEYRFRENLRYTGRYLFVDGAYREVEIAADGSGIALTGNKAGTGSLRIETPPGEAPSHESLFVVTVAGANGEFQLLGEKPTDTFGLPAGTYRIRRADLNRAGAGDGWWRINAGGRSMSPSTFEIRPGEATRLGIGPPLTARATARKVGTGIQFDFTLIGREGMNYWVGHGSNMAAPPKIKLAAKTGGWEKECSFKYNREWDRLLTVSEPLPKGVIEIIPTVESGPFEVKCETTEFTVE